MMIKTMIKMARSNLRKIKMKKKRKRKMTGMMMTEKLSMKGRVGRRMRRIIKMMKMTTVTAAAKGPKRAKRQAQENPQMEKAHPRVLQNLQENPNQVIRNHQQRLHHRQSQVQKVLPQNPRPSKYPMESPKKKSYNKKGHPKPKLELSK